MASVNSNTIIRTSLLSASVSVDSFCFGWTIKLIKWTFAFSSVFFLKGKDVSELSLHCAIKAVTEYFPQRFMFYPTVVRKDWGKGRVGTPFSADLQTSVQTSAELKSAKGERACTRGHIGVLQYLQLQIPLTDFWNLILSGSEKPLRSLC